MDKKLVVILSIVFAVIVAIVIACSCAGVFISDKITEQKEQLEEQLGNVPDGKRIVFVNNDMWDTPPGWEFVIEKSESGDDILILRPVEQTKQEPEEETPIEEVTEEPPETESPEEEQNDENKEVE